MPSIDVYIHLPSPPLLDLTSRTTPFTITIDLVLNHPRAITLPRHALDDFAKLDTFDGGLTFTDTSTGQVLQRSLVCVLSDDAQLPPFSRRTQSAFVTLSPGSKVTLTMGFRPVEERPWFIGNGGRCMSEQETRMVRTRLRPITQWRGVREFEDGVTYEIGLTRPALTYKWMEGSKAELLSWWSLLASFFAGRVVERTQAIPLRIIKPASFMVRRPADPEENERIDWPVFVRNLDEWCAASPEKG